MERLAGIRVGVYGSGGAPWHHLALAAVHGAETLVVRAEDISAGRLDALDALVFPGGGAFAMTGLMAPLGEEGASKVRDWVARGGTYIGSCAGSVLPIALSGAADQAIPAARCLRLVDVPLANPGDSTLGGLTSPGVGRIVVRVDGSHPYTRGLQQRLELVHYNGPLFDVSRAGPSVRAFAWPLGATEQFTPSERFMAAADPPHEGPTTFSDCIARGAATGVEAPVGEGRAVLFGSHPEFGSGPLCLGWGDGAEMLVRALEASRGATDSAPATPGWAVSPEFPGSSPTRLAAIATRELLRAAERFDLLAAADVGAWLGPGHAASFHGVDARDAWSAELHAAARACAASAGELMRLGPALKERALVWLDDQPGEGQDFGALGLHQLLAKLHGQLDEAERLIPERPRRPQHAYDLFDAHPFHLAMGSYLSAAGLAAAALLTVTVLATLTDFSSVKAHELLWA